MLPVFTGHLELIALGERCALAEIGARRQRILGLALVQAALAWVGVTFDVWVCAVVIGLLVVPQAAALGDIVHLRFCLFELRCAEGWLLSFRGKEVSILTRLLIRVQRALPPQSDPSRLDESQGYLSAARAAARAAAGDAAGAAAGAVAGDALSTLVARVQERAWPLLDDMLDLDETSLGEEAGAEALP